MTARRNARWLAALVAALLLCLAMPAGAQDAVDPEPTAAPDRPALGSSDTTNPGSPSLDVPNPYNPYAVPSFAGLGGPPAPVIVGSGADALIKPPDLRGDNEPTLLERYGAQGHSLDSQTGFGSGADQALNALAGGIFAIATWIAQIVIATFQWAFDLEIFSFVGDAISSIVGGIERMVYQPFVIVAVVLAGLSMTWTGLVRRRGTVAAEQASWTVFALTVAVLFLAAPSALVDGANQVATGISRGVLTAVSVADPMTGPDDGLVAQATFEGSAADNQLRMAADRFWRVFVHQPWLVLQFGDLDTGRKFGERLLEAKTIGPDELEVVAGDPEALAALTEAKRETYMALQEEVFADPRAAEWFRGRRAVERVGVATLALAGVSLGGLLLVVVAAATLLAQVGFLLLVLLGPIALLVGIHPGIGRVIAWRWAGLLAGLLLKRVTLGALLAVVLVINGVLLDAAYPLGWLVVMGLQTLVVAAVVVYRKPFTKLLGPTTVPVLGARQGSAAPAGTTPAEIRARLGISTLREPAARTRGPARPDAPARSRAPGRPAAAAPVSTVAQAAPAPAAAPIGRFQRWRRTRPPARPPARASVPTGPSVADLVAAAEGRRSGGSATAPSHRPPAAVAAAEKRPGGEET